MRTVELAKVAVAAEALRLRRIARQQAVRAAVGVAAGIFAISALATLHLVAWTAIRPYLSPLITALILLAFDIVVCGILAVMAIRGVPDPIEAEAKALRVQALEEMKRSLTVMGMAAEVAGTVFRARARTGTRRGAASIAAHLASRLVGR